jgi:hypothetical protein
VERPSRERRSSQARRAAQAGEHDPLEVPVQVDGRLAREVRADFLEARAEDRVPLRQRAPRQLLQGPVVPEAGVEDGVVGDEIRQRGLLGRTRTEESAQRRARGGERAQTDPEAPHGGDSRAAAAKSVHF